MMRMQLPEPVRSASNESLDYSTSSSEGEEEEEKQEEEEQSDTAPSAIFSPPIERRPGNSPPSKEQTEAEELLAMFPDQLKSITDAVRVIAQHEGDAHAAAATLIAAGVHESAEGRSVPERIFKIFNGNDDDDLLERRVESDEDFNADQGLGREGARILRGRRRGIQ